MNKLYILSIVLLFTGVGCVPQNPTVIQNSPTDSPTKTIQQSVVLDYSHQNLTTVPQNIFSQTTTQELDLSFNQLTGALPSQINQLKNLTVLKANNNQFTGVPAEIGQLPKLEVLDLSNNQLTGLPYELGNLSNLKLLDLSGNNISSIDLEHIRAELPAQTEIRL